MSSFLILLHLVKVGIRVFLQLGHLGLRCIIDLGGAVGLGRVSILGGYAQRFSGIHSDLEISRFIKLVLQMLLRRHEAFQNFDIIIRIE